MDAEIEKAEDLQIKKKFPKNWSDLPTEIKREVIKYIDFQSSLRLRQTARLERFLVDSKKFNFFKVRIHAEAPRMEDGYMGIFRQEEDEEPFSSYNGWMQDLAPLMAHILKIGNIDELDIDSCESFMQKFLRNVDSIRIKRLYMEGSFPVDSVALLLSKCPEVLDSVEIHHHDNYDYCQCGFLVYKASDLAKISNTKMLEYECSGGYLDRNRFSEIVKAFAERQNTVGTTVMVTIRPRNAILNSSSTPVQSGDRIPTSDPNIEILFEVKDSDVNGMDDVNMHFVPTEAKIE